VLNTPIRNAMYLPLGESRAVRLGQSVFMIGFPAVELLGPEAKFSEGSISSLSGPGGEAFFLQTTVPVQPGSSGGPLIDGNGNVIGVVTSSAAIRPFLAATGSLPQNINWAVKIDHVRPLFDSLKALPATRDRGESIDRARSATCLIQAVTGE